MHALLLALSLSAFAQDPAPADEAPTSPPLAQSNADLQMSITTVDGETTSGHVVRIERSDDVYGEKGWLDDEKSLKFYVENEKRKEYKKITWDQVKAVTVKVVSAKDINCLYSSDYTPWLYQCDAKLSSQLTTKDGKRYDVDSGHKWRFIFSNGEWSEVWFKRHYAHQKDDRRVELGDDTENVALYQALQTKLKAELKTSLVKSISAK